VIIGWSRICVCETRSSSLRDWYVEDVPGALTLGDRCDENNRL
jgi:hypothetical protein